MSIRFSSSRSQWAILLAAAALLAALPGCRTAAPVASRPIQTIAFGSCMNTNAHPLLDELLQHDFDLSILLGDNIYADTTNMTVMKAKYDTLKQSDFWSAFRRKAPILATWDDHDFGGNDAGANYPQKVESQRLFLEFLDEPPDSVRWKRPGVYDAKVFGPPGRRVQVILLDTRYFRSPLTTGIHNATPSGGPYIPDANPALTMLGEAQWQWLEEQLRAPAEVRVIASSIQFISEFSGAEAWANFPREKKRLLDLLQQTGARRVLFISGDRHWAELSRMTLPNGQVLYDLTSSAMTQKHPRGTPTPNQFRVGTTTYHEANFGLIHLSWEDDRPAIKLELIDAAGQVRIAQEFVL